MLQLGVTLIEHTFKEGNKFAELLASGFPEGNVNFPIFSMTPNLLIL